MQDAVYKGTRGCGLVFASSISSLICCMHASIKLNSSGHTGQVAWQEQVSTRFTLMSLSSLVSDKTLLAPRKAAHRNNTPPLLWSWYYIYLLEGNITSKQYH